MRENMCASQIRAVFSGFHFSSFILSQRFCKIFLGRCCSYCCLAIRYDFRFALRILLFAQHDVMIPLIASLFASSATENKRTNQKKSAPKSCNWWLVTIPVSSLITHSHRHRSYSKIVTTLTRKCVAATAFHSHSQIDDIGISLSSCSHICVPFTRKIRKRNDSSQWHCLQLQTGVAPSENDGVMNCFYGVNWKHRNRLTFAGDWNETLNRKNVDRLIMPKVRWMRFCDSE